ncbi:hypothetical protein FisN_1Lu106 [Fistulifera solaris]|uniref:Uncharacterized protein n=1 Tax=Fistulifera solaris TaxID=1519565 RepID=A0A1Z5K4U4_FISSO|nr:hypothetical protein FisN_1Lu106 [Fistulifera solaris]|eukprot:GAX21270.1 hypothetical protein FisN_1Lu106 [Fistulifera solaris]
MGCATFLLMSVLRTTQDTRVLKLHGWRMATISRSRSPNGNHSMLVDLFGFLLLGSEASDGQTPKGVFLNKFSRFVVRTNTTPPYFLGTSQHRTPIFSG